LPPSTACFLLPKDELLAEDAVDLLLAELAVLAEEWLCVLAELAVLTEEGVEAELTLDGDWLDRDCVLVLLDEPELKVLAELTDDLLLADEAVLAELKDRLLSDDELSLLFDELLLWVLAEDTDSVCELGVLWLDGVDTLDALDELSCQMHGVAWVYQVG